MLPTVDQVQELNPSEELGVAGEGQADRGNGGGDSRFHLEERRRQPFHVLTAASRTDVGITGAQWRAMERGREAADQYVFDSVTLENPNHLLGLEAGHPRQGLRSRRRARRARS
ncbi:MAG TPA: hypothetical protein VIE88_17075 [Vicinamibacteria bacterium]